MELERRRDREIVRGEGDGEREIMTPYNDDYYGSDVKNAMTQLQKDVTKRMQKHDSTVSTRYNDVITRPNSRGVINSFWIPVERNIPDDERPSRKLIERRRKTWGGKQSHTYAVEKSVHKSEADDMKRRTWDSTQVLIEI